jgi:Cdc6-like AAA superfamily ATPase
MAVAYGPAGIGKTHVLAAITAEIPTAVAITAGYDTRSVKKLLRVLYVAVAGRRRREKTEMGMEALIDKLRMPPRVKTRNLIIVDQAHELPAAAWRALMELHDRARCSVLLLGTIDLKTQVATDSDPEFGQLSSRIGMRVDLAPELLGSLRGAGKRGERRLFTVAEIRRLFARSKVKLHPEAARMLCEIANTRRGTLRRVVRLFYWAEIAAERAGAELITVEHLRAASGLVEDEVELPSGAEATGGAEAAIAAG